MSLMLFGRLTEPSVKLMLASAQMQPEHWQIYLVKTTGVKRTPAQNSLFRVLLRKMAQQQGKSVKFWHDYLVEKFLGFDEIDTEDGYTRSVLCSTASLTVAEFAQFLTAVLVFASENHIDLG